MNDAPDPSDLLPATLNLIALHTPCFLALCRKRTLDAKMDDERRTHPELPPQKSPPKASPPAEARLEARRHFGGLTQTQDVYRDQRGIPLLDVLFQDLRYSLRTLVRAPAFGAVAILTLALGIGVNTAIFSVVNAVVLRPLPYDDSTRLVALWETTTEHQRSTVSVANLVDYASMNQVFTGMASYARPGMNLTEAGPPERLWAEQASTNLFTILGVRPALGRDFRPGEDRPGNHRVVILSHELWQQRFGADPQIISRSIHLDGELYQVIGIMPPGFQSPSQFGFTGRISIYVPAAYSPQLLSSRGDHEVNVLARLKPAVLVQQPQTDMDRISASPAAAYPASNNETGTP